MDHPTQQFCTFHVDNLFLGIAVQQVQEVFRFQQMTRVPLAPNAVHGLINLRGATQKNMASLVQKDDLTE